MWATCRRRLRGCSLVWLSREAGRYNLRAPHGETRPAAATWCEQAPRRTFTSTPWTLYRYYRTMARMASYCQGGGLAAQRARRMQMSGYQACAVDQVDIQSNKSVSCILGQGCVSRITCSDLQLSADYVVIRYKKLYYHAM